jgi:hypothetical protein
MLALIGHHEPGNAGALQPHSKAAKREAVAMVTLRPIIGNPLNASMRESL